MPFALLIIGVVLLTAGVRNTQNTLFSLLKGDFTGQSNFVFWFVSIMIIGSIGYIPKLKPISTGFLVLVLMVLFLTKGNPSGVGGGFFAQFTSALNSTQQSATGTQTASTTPTLGQLQAQQIQLMNQLSQNLAVSGSALSQDLFQ